MVDVGLAAVGDGLAAAAHAALLRLPGPGAAAPPLHQRPRLRVHPQHEAHQEVRVTRTSCAFLFRLYSVQKLSLPSPLALSMDSYEPKYVESLNSQQ